MRAHKMHYLIVLDNDNTIQILNCSEETRKTDKFIVELHKDDFYEIEDLVMEGEGRCLRGESLEVFMKYYQLWHASLKDRE